MNLKPIGFVNSTKFQFEWHINSNDFTSTTVGQNMSTDALITHSFGKDIKWRLDLYPKGDEKAYEDYISIFFKNISGFSVEATITFYLLNTNKLKVKKSNMSKYFFHSGQSWGYSEFVKQNFVVDRKNNLLKSGEITFGCQVVIDSITNDFQKSFNRICEFDDFEKLFLNETFSDLTVVTAEGKSFRVHKNILASRSNVFEVMFDHDMIEKKKNIVNIKDIKYEVLLEVFRFIYCGKINKKDAMLFDNFVCCQ